MRDAEPVGDAAGVVDVLAGAAAALAAGGLAMVVKLQRDADDVMAWCFRIAATTEESTPPDMATTTSAASRRCRAKRRYWARLVRSSCSSVSVGASRARLRAALEGRGVWTCSRDGMRQRKRRPVASGNDLSGTTRDCEALRGVTASQQIGAAFRVKMLRS